LQFKFSNIVSSFIASIPIMLICSSEIIAETTFPDTRIIRWIKGANIDSEDVSQMRENAIAKFNLFDFDGGGIGLSDFTYTHRRRAASFRARIIQEWAENDLDVNGVVSRAELATILRPSSRRYLQGDGFHLKPTPEQEAAALNALVDQASVNDQNRDGEITFLEILAAASEQATERLGESTTYSELIAENSIMVFDTDQDRTVTQVEFEAVIDHFLSWKDLNGNGHFEQLENEAYTEALHQANRQMADEATQRRLDAERAEQADICGRLIVPDNASTVVVGGYEGKAISTVSIGDPNDTTGVIDIKIGIGATPIFLMLDNYKPTIWRISGFTQRVVGVGIDKDVAGIIGISADKIQYFNSLDCELDLWTTSRTGGTREATLISAVLGETPGVIISSYEFGLVNIPGGASSREYRYPDVRPRFSTLAGRQVEQDLRRFNPGGIVDIDVSEVVSHGEVTPYEVLPIEAGLAELAETGAIEPTGFWLHTPIDGLRMGSQGLVFRTSAGKVFRTMGGDDLITDDGRRYRMVGGSVERSFIGDRTYVIRETIDLPPGLSGAHSVLFLLPVGMQPPRGDAGGSELRVFAE